MAVTVVVDDGIDEEDTAAMMIVGMMTMTMALIIELVEFTSLMSGLGDMMATMMALAKTTARIMAMMMMLLTKSIYMAIMMTIF